MWLQSIMKSKLTDKRVCLKCNSETTYINVRGSPEWRHFKDGYLCSRCYDRKRSKQPKRKESQKRTFTYKHVRMYSKWLKRKYKCSKCGKQTKQSNWHHALGYFPSFPWLGLEELCVNCHKETHGINRWMHR